MKLPISLLLLSLAAGAASAQTVAEPEGDGPRGSSRVEAGEIRYDEVGYAGTATLSGMTAASTGLAAGSFAEITALDSGKTILVAIAGGAADAGQLIGLSPDAASALGIASAFGSASAPAGVRVRRVTPTPQDASLLTTGQIASGRADAPLVLLVPLRKKLAALPASNRVVQLVKPARKPVTPAPLAERPARTAAPRPATPAPPPARTGDYLVQIATLSDGSRARALAAKVGGRVIPSGALFRVQTGPFTDRAAAQRGQAAAVQLGHRDAQIIRTIK